jgi:hypothetical protein
MSLLAKAKAVPVKGKAAPAVDPEHLELALAFLRREVTGSQIAVALEVAAGSAGSWVLTTIRAGLDTGAISIVKAPAVKAVAK